MPKPIIHLLSIAGSDRNLAAQLGLDSNSELLDYLRQVIGPEYRLSANLKLLDADVDEALGGRRDDALRIRALQQLLGDEQVTAVVSLRGGAWLTRILSHVDFDVLKKRRAPVSIFGFSELTTLVNIMAGYRCVRAYYDIAPGFLLWGLKHYAARHYDELTRGIQTEDPDDPARRSAFTLGWAKGNFNLEFSSLFLDLLDIIDGGRSNRVLTGRLNQGTIRNQQTIKVFGGCLSLVVTMLGSSFKRCINPKGKWLALEDIREESYRLDRYLAHLKWAGVFEQCEGLLLGDFHLQTEDQTDAVLHLLKHHLPPRRRLPIITHCNFGHCYTCAPLPINQPLVLRRTADADEKTVTLLPK